MSRPVSLTLLRRALTTPQSWIEPVGATYRVRLGPDRRARPGPDFGEAALLALIETPGLTPRLGGGWTLRPSPQTAARSTGGEPGRPGFIEGEQQVIDPADASTSRFVRRSANLGESALAWLARRKGADGRPFISPAQFAAGERLRREAQQALGGPSVVMRWDALPRAGGGSAARMEPTERALHLAKQVEAALHACGPRHRPIVETICIRQSSLALAEHDLGLKRREGRIWLSQGLARLARHYGYG